MTIQWGILGAGDIADRHMAPAIGLAHNHELMAVMCRTIEKARAFAQKHAVARAYDQVEDLLSDNQLNAVYVATPPHLHAQNTIRAAECGKHVLCEKPMALNVAEARAMIESCRANQVSLMVCHYQRLTFAIGESRCLRLALLVSDGGQN
jgi:predicted dehydrogenase